MLKFRHILKWTVSLERFQTRSICSFNFISTRNNKTAGCPIQKFHNEEEKRYNNNKINLSAFIGAIGVTLASCDLQPSDKDKKLFRSIQYGLIGELKT